MKRSTQVALLLMGVTSAGAAAYSLAPERGCVPADKPAAVAPGAAAPGVVTPETLAPGAVAVLQPANPCPPRRRWSWGRGSNWSYRSYYDSSSPSAQPTRRSLFSSSTSHTSVPSVGRSSSSRSSSSGSSGSRGGFGSTGHSVGSHSSGG